MQRRLHLLALGVALAACSSTPPRPTARMPAPAPTPGVPGMTAPAPAPLPSTALPPPPPPLPPPAGSAEQRTALAAELTVEQQWLDSFFKGTPVQIRQRDDGALSIDVPREFCFDTGRSNVKPALAAVLDKLAESLRRRPAAILTLVAAPDDQPGATTLALQRAAQVQKHLRDRGVAVSRLGEPKAAAGAGVQLRVVAPPG